MPGSFVPQRVLEDPMLAKSKLDLRGLYFPLGFPLEVQTNSRSIIEAAAEAWGSFSQSSEMASMRLALGVKEGAEPEPWPAESTFVTREHLLTMIANTDNFVMCDFQHAFSFGWITPKLASDSATLRYRFLTPVAMMMAQQLALASLHGALVARNGCGVMLCGDSFAGKSTLAYAAARSGWTYITDDGTFLVRDRSDRYAVGNPHFIRFREDARQLFPELSERLVVTRPNGRIGMELATRDLDIATAPGTNIEHVIFLERNHKGPVILRRRAKEEMQSWCEGYVNFGSAEVQAAQTRCHRRLLGAHIWEMSYEHFDDAVRRLEQLVDSGG